MFYLVLVSSYWRGAPPTEHTRRIDLPNRTHIANNSVYPTLFIAYVRSGRNHARVRSDENPSYRAHRAPESTARSRRHSLCQDLLRNADETEMLQGADVRGPHSGNSKGIDADGYQMGDNRNGPGSGAVEKA